MLYNWFVKIEAVQVTNFALFCASAVEKSSPEAFEASSRHLCSVNEDHGGLPPFWTNHVDMVCLVRYCLVNSDFRGGINDDKCHG